MKYEITLKPVHIELYLTGSIKNVTFRSEANLFDLEDSGNKNYTVIKTDMRDKCFKLLKTRNPTLITIEKITENTNVSRFTRVINHVLWLPDQKLCVIGWE